MSALLILAIRLFRRLRPKDFRTRCLFRESCSRRVEREARAHGFVAAMRVLRARMRECRAGSVPALDAGGAPTLLLASGRLANADELDLARVDEAFAPLRAWRPDGGSARGRA